MKNNQQFVIVDWANNIMFNGKTFDSFNDGWEFIYENIKDENNAYDDVMVIEMEVK